MLQRMAGYRYGKANGNSYNTRDNKHENGASMASVVGLSECRSFATMHAKENRQKIYYIGTIAGKGGDDEYLLTNITRISSKEYKIWLENNKNITAAYIQKEAKELEWARDYAISNMMYPWPHKIKEIEKMYAEKINCLYTGC